MLRAARRSSQLRWSLGVLLLFGTSPAVAWSNSDFPEWELFRQQVAERFDAVWPDPRSGKFHLESITVRWASDLGALRGRVAVTEGRSIQVRPGTTGIRLGMVLEHELAHVFTGERCHAYERDPWISELIAQLLSHDFERIRGGRFAFQSEALRFLEDTEQNPRSRPSMDDPRWGESASRILMSLQARGSDESQFWEKVRTCDPVAVRSWMKKALNQSVPKQPPRWVLLETQSGAVIQSEGSVDSPVPLGSVLKTALVAWSPTFRRPTRSRLAEPSWACESGSHEKKERLWTWQEALAASCNGYFLDAALKLPAKDRREIARRLAALGIQSEDSGSDLVPEWMGVRPGVQGSLRQVGELYRLLIRTAPTVVTALKQTALQGTLAGLPDSSWFQAAQVGLKSGTRRTPDAQPIDGWIVAWTPAWTLVVAQEGQAPRQLLAFVRQKLEPWLSQSESATRMVQTEVLGLVPESQIEWRCSGIWVEEGSPSRVQPELRVATGTPLSFQGGGASRGRGSCFGAPLQARFLDSKGETVERAYQGSMERQELRPRLNEVSGLLRPRSLRARRGSPWIFRTTEREYLRGVLVNEAEPSRLETLKALALVAAWNVEQGGVVRHPDRQRVCDSTHCQVFSGARRVSPSRASLLRVEEALATLGTERLESDERWLPFALGGEEPWERKIPLDSWRSRLALTQIHLQLGKPTSLAVQGSVLEGSLLGMPWKRSCEWFREQLQLPSCPDSIRMNSEGLMEIQGHGEGHRLGLQLKLADEWAIEGRSHREILARFFPNVRVVARSGEKLRKRNGL